MEGEGSLPTKHRLKRPSTNTPNISPILSIHACPRLTLLIHMY